MFCMNLARTVLKNTKPAEAGLMQLIYFQCVRMEGVEPTRLAALDPKSSASANFATSAVKAAKIGGFY